MDIRWAQDGSTRVLVPDRVTTPDDLTALHEAVLVALADADAVVCDLSACHLEVGAPQLADTLAGAVADRALSQPNVTRPGEVAESGRGLLLVDALARSWHVLPRRGGGKVIRAVLVASAAPAPNR